MMTRFPETRKSVATLNRSRFPSKGMDEGKTISDRQQLLSRLREGSFARYYCLDSEFISIVLVRDMFPMQLMGLPIVCDSATSEHHCSHQPAARGTADPCTRFNTISVRVDQDQADPCACSCANVFSISSRSSGIERTPVEACPRTTRHPLDVSCLVIMFHDTCMDYLGATGWVTNPTIQHQQ